MIAQGFHFATSFYGNGETKFPSLRGLYRFVIALWRAKQAQYRRRFWIPLQIA